MEEFEQRVYAQWYWECNDCGWIYDSGPGCCLCGGLLVWVDESEIDDDG